MSINTFMGITEKDPTYARPALWGFFVCIALLAVLLVIRSFIPSILKTRCDADRLALRTRAEQVIHNAFQKKTEQLTKIVEHASGDSTFKIGMNLDNKSETLRAFQSLQSYRLTDDQTIDLVDSQGTILAWNGPSVASLYKQVVHRHAPEPFVYVTQNGLRLYLSVGKKLTSDRFMLFVSEPLEVNSPISNRYVQKVSICEGLSQILRTQVTLRLPQTYTAHEGEYSIPIVDLEDKTIAEFFVDEPTLESRISSAQDTSLLLIDVCAGCACLFFVNAALFWIAKKKHKDINTAALIISLWFVRLLWRELNFPAALIGGWLFNPNLYASPFFLGLSSSLGELFLTALTAVASTWFFFIRFTSRREAEGKVWSLSSRTGHAGSIAFMCIVSLSILWLFRGFGEAVRSFVFDSTIQYYNPTEILPDGDAALMYLIIILLGVALLSVSTALFSTGEKIISRYYSQNKTTARVIFISIIIICVPIFALIDGTQLITLFVSIIFIALCIMFVESISFWNAPGRDVLSRQWKFAAWMTLGSFMVGAPLLHLQLQQREHNEVEAVGNEFLRPSDSWLTYAVQDGLRTSLESVPLTVDSSFFSTAKENNLAFVLWTKSLIGREGYSSACMLYNQQGNEMDRFVVGMTKPEQETILSKVFAGEEAAVHVVDRTETKTLGKLYGAWTTIRDSSGQLLGSIAFLLSEHQKGIFHEEDTEPLRQLGDRLDNNAAREIAVHEYINDSLVFSTGRRLYPERILSAAIEKELKNTINAVLWKDMFMNGYKTQTLYMRDPATPERIAALSLEQLDFRWDMFGYLKQFLICLAVLGGIGFYFTMRNGSLHDIPPLGFRGKLVLGFACITLVPLGILSYYNRQLVIERVQQQGERELYSELIKLQNRISAYVTDEEDFVKGVDDDFCEALAAEDGVDFSIYRGATIQASSRSELYRASLLDGRLNSQVFASILLERKGQVLAKEKIGSVVYLVGYTPLFIDGNVVGVLAIPALNKQRDIEAEISQQNVYVFGVYAVIFGIALAAGGVIAVRFARPLQTLTRAAKNVAEGDLEIHISVKSHDEMGTLAQSFNDMVSKLRASRKELAQHERENAWKEMAKQVAHEIRNPLTPMKLSIQHVRQAFKDRAPEREEILQRVTQTVIDQIETLSRIATEFSHFAKMPEAKFERVSIDELLKETINLFKEVQGISFLDQLACPDVRVIADGGQLRGVFINIVRNAIQAIDKIGTISIGTGKEGRMCLITISDTGPGIPDDIRAKIFEPNFSTKSEGMGIGLAIARRVIEDHGGTIICQSGPGKGTTFEIRFPV